MITLFKEQYFAFLMGGTVGEFRAAAETLNVALSYGATLEQAQGCMDEAKTEAELLCLLFDSPSVQGAG